MRVKVVAAKTMKYAGRMLQPGDEFHPTRTEARALKAIGRAVDPPAEPVEQKRGRGRPPKVRTEPPVAEMVEQAGAPATDMPTTSYEDRAPAASEAFERRYGRRDLEAED
jgi:hypothetical protein